MNKRKSLFKQGRYSGYLKPISYVIDLSIINSLAIFYFFTEIESNIFITFTTIAWIILSVYSGFYQVYRYTREVKILSLIITQMIFFTLLMFSLSGFYYGLEIYPKVVFKYILVTFIIITFFKFATFFLLQKYRISFGGNYRKTIIFGENNKTKALEDFFNKNPEYGYIHIKTFNIKENRKTSLDYYFEYIKEEKIDEIYVSISELSNQQIREIIDFADNNLKILKFLPDNKEIYSKKLNYEYYDYISILSLRNIPLDDSLNMFLKRSFDIIFSCLVIIFVLSWLTPILAILIKLESRGPVFFKQSRNGFKYRAFDCYKFRSMTPNKKENLHQATKGDVRITRVGKFIRKTSLDELPQFFNVLFGQMSVVGPRPHMISHTDMYAKKINKFMVRHLIKPGITGLAQIKGYRGEVIKDKDIIGRVKYDIFYIENWSLLLDFNIIVQTVLNVFKGEEKAY